mgnify:CR=1 FL=1
MWAVGCGREPMIKTDVSPGSVHRLEIWRDGLELAEQIYTITKTWPKEELYGLVSRARRSSISIPSNIAEGVGRASRKELARFAQIALGSAYELETLLQPASSLGYSPEETIALVQKSLNRLTRRKSAFIRKTASDSPEPQPRKPESDHENFGN